MTSRTPVATVLRRSLLNSLPCFSATTLLSAGPLPDTAVYLHANEYYKSALEDFCKFATGILERLKHLADMTAKVNAADASAS